MSRVMRLYSSMRLFSTGVAVSSRRNRFLSEFTSFQFRVFLFLRWWASSTITMSYSCSVTWLKFFFDLAWLMDARTKSDFQNPFLFFKSWSSVETKSRLNLAASSSFHWLTRGVGVRINAFFTIPLSIYSFRIIEASMVLPSPTSSESMARPRKLFNTLRAVSSWYQKDLTLLSCDRQIKFSKESRKRIL